MSKAEELAKEYAEKFILTVDHQGDVEEAYIDGYHQAEKDLELTWEDIDMLLKISPFVDEQHCDNNREFCKEVLKRFKERKGK